jgi:hypothetical protein
MTAALGLAMAILVGGFFCPLLVSAYGENFWAVTAAWIPMTTLMIIATCIHVARKRARGGDPAASPLSAPGIR